MSSYPETVDVFADLTSENTVGSSDPNHAFETLENIEAFFGALGKPQTWNETLLVLLSKYRRGMHVDYVGGTLYARAGEAVLRSSDGNKHVFRRNPSDVTISSANLDTGTLATTFYYVYAKGDTLATTAPITFSTHVDYPSGIGTAPFRKIGWFKNEAVGSLAITFAGSWLDGNAVPNALSVINPYDVLNLTYSSYSNLGTAPLTINFISSGRPIKLTFIAPIAVPANTAFYGRIVLDDVQKAFSIILTDSLVRMPFALHWLDVDVAAGAHTAKVQFKGDDFNVYGDGYGNSIFILQEL